MQNRLLLQSYQDEQFYLDARIFGVIITAADDSTAGKGASCWLQNWKFQPRQTVGIWCLTLWRSTH